jgi:hypothetical protein
MARADRACSRSGSGKSCPPQSGALARRTCDEGSSSLICAVRRARSIPSGRGWLTCCPHLFSQIFRDCRSWTAEKESAPPRPTKISEINSSQSRCSRKETWCGNLGQPSLSEEILPRFNRRSEARAMRSFLRVRRACSEKETGSSLFGRRLLRCLQIPSF